jgi:GNAT superfamily N-acetyltransferase
MNSNIVHVQRLTEASRPGLERHFLSLEAEDVRLRFGAKIAPAAIASYVARIDFDVDAVLGVHDESLSIIGVAHVAFTGGLAELGVSVLSGHRGDGIGTALLARAADHVRNRFVTRLFMHCLAENAAMLHIARKLGMTICVNTGEADAFLKLQPADPASVAGEFVNQRLALFDYALKAQAMTFNEIAVDRRSAAAER